MNGADLPDLRYPELLQAPHKIPSLVPFSRTTVYLLIGPETIQRNPSSVVLRATSSHGPLALEIPIEAVSERGTTIHQLAARKASQDLEESRGWVFDGKVADGVLINDKYPGKFEALVHKEGVRLGETFQVANKWCSFVAVAANDDVIMEGNPCDTGTDTSTQGFGSPLDSYRELAVACDPAVFSTENSVSDSSVRVASPFGSVASFGRVASVSSPLAQSAKPLFSSRVAAAAMERVRGTTSSFVPSAPQGMHHCP
jgi:hypothetical protein